MITPIIVAFMVSLVFAYNDHDVRRYNSNNRSLEVFNGFDSVQRHTGIGESIL